MSLYFFLPVVAKNINAKVFNLMSISNETRYLEWHETCKCKCRVDACECKELIDLGSCDKGFIWNPSNCQCESDKSCDTTEYVNY